MTEYRIDVRITPLAPAARTATLELQGQSLTVRTFAILRELSVDRDIIVLANPEIAGLPYTLIFLESPHRLLPALEDVESVLGDRQVAVARELTKMFEETRRGTLKGLADHYTATPPKGEIVIVVKGKGR